MYLIFVQLKYTLTKWATCYLAVWFLCHLKNFNTGQRVKNCFWVLVTIDKKYIYLNKMSTFNRQTKLGEDQKTLGKWHLDTDMHFSIDARMAI